MLQELKCLTEAFPYQAIEDFGYNFAVHGQKTYNGVAILSKFPLSDVITDFPNNPIANEARYIEAVVNLPDSAVRVASVYVPNGQSLDSDKYLVKLEFLESLGNYYQELVKNQEMIIIGGDFNIALTDLDVYDSSLLNESILFSSSEKQQLRRFMATGLMDSYRMLNPMEAGFTWWDYRAQAYRRNLGMRIDYLFCSPEAAQRNIQCIVTKEWRGKERPSDHAPVMSIFS